MNKKFIMGLVATAMLSLDIKENTQNQQEKEYKLQKAQEKRERKLKKKEQECKKL